jgi:hypothetical protein
MSKKKHRSPKGEGLKTLKATVQGPRDVSHFDCSRLWKIRVGSGVNVTPAEPGGKGQVLTAKLDDTVSGQATTNRLLASAVPGAHEVLLMQTETDSRFATDVPDEWTIHIASGLEVSAPEDDPRYGRVIRVTGDQGTNISGIVSAAKPRVGFLVSPAPPENVE